MYQYLDDPYAIASFSRTKIAVETNLVFHSQSYPFPPFQCDDWAGSDRALKRNSDRH
ncbi:MULTISPECIES: hypothetical protein [Cyanophyceae]|uniref:hypothetical protein n=1 Tax=Cyanophyceae TaxID=3028117 RepID=UPI001681EA25|nr:hypothetical protein [Trichocoleus sp. FACHB-69]MBD1931784.1 hypothetical protein [Trichocoleus sp. FACHB-69]